MIDLNDTYLRLAQPWTHPQLAARYSDAEQRGAQLIAGADDDFTRPLPLVARAIPPSATLSVAIHILHTLPTNVRGDLPRQLLDTAETNAADALHRCHRALELDGAAHHYSADEWLPVVCDIAAPLLESARLNQEPPTVVRQTQEAVNWLSHAVVDLDQDAPDAATTLAETIARLLTVWVFADAARDGQTPDDQ